MKTRLLGLAVVMVAMAVMVNAMALSSFTQANSFTLSVVTPDLALVAFDTATGADGDVTVDLSAGKLDLTFAHGVQQNSTYEFSPAFKIKNNSKNAVNLGWVAGAGAPTGVTVTFHNAADNVQLTSLPAEMAAWIDVKVKVVASGTAAGGGTYGMTLTATRP